MEATNSLINFKKSWCSFFCAFNFESAVDLTLQSRFINWYFYSWEIIKLKIVWQMYCLSMTLDVYISSTWCSVIFWGIIAEFKCSSSLFSMEAISFAQEVQWFRSRDPISVFVVCCLQRRFSPWYMIPQELGGRQSVLFGEYKQKVLCNQDQESPIYFLSLLLFNELWAQTS